MIDYFKAAEEDIRSLPQLRRALEILKAKEKRLIEAGAPKRATLRGFGESYVDSSRVNDALNEALSLTEVCRAFRKTAAKIGEIEHVLGELPDERRRVLMLFYEKGMSAAEVAEEIGVESEKTVYSIRNRGIADFAILYYGATDRRR